MTMPSPRAPDNPTFVGSRAGQPSIIERMSALGTREVRALLDHTRTEPRALGDLAGPYRS
jgi:hypothetical protein